MKGLGASTSSFLAPSTTKCIFAFCVHIISDYVAPNPSLNIYTSHHIQHIKLNPPLKQSIKQLLIVGIDPGTTTAYALLDTRGNLLYTDSSKELDISALIFAIIGKGLPLIVGCDKKKAPGFVDEFATKVGARLVSPDEDMKVDEKQEMTKRFKENLNNTHEMDALASALFAFRKHKALFEKIENALRREDKLDKILEVTKLVFSTEEGLPIKVALDIIERPETEEAMTIKKAIERKEKNIDYASYVKLYDSTASTIDLLNTENRYLKEYSRKLKHEMELLRHDFNRMIKEIKKKQEKNSDEMLVRKINDKENVICVMKKNIEDEKEHSKKMQRKISALNEVIMNADRYVIIRKIDNLGEAYNKMTEQSSRESSSIIRPDDILFVKDASVCNENNAKELKTKFNVQTIITEKPNKIISQHFRVIEREKIKDIPYKETDEFLFVDRKEFETFLKNNFVFERIVKEYKEERKS